MNDTAPSASPTSSGIDATLLARMTGRLGDRQTVEQIAGTIAAALCDPLQDALQRLAGCGVTATRSRIDLGLRSDLERSIGNASVRSAAAIKGWCHEIAIAADGALAIGFAEALLGGAEPETAAVRAPSAIELDVSIVLFEQILGALKGILGIPDAIATTDQPSIGADVADDAEGPGAHGVLMTLAITIGRLEAELHIILPQVTVTKTRVAAPKPADRATSNRQPEWAEQLKNQIVRSDVLLKARIHLAPMTLGAFSQLRPGDVLAFADEKEVEVDLDANGKPIYRCELGRSGNRYMVRLKAAQSLEADLVAYLGG